MGTWESTQVHFWHEYEKFHFCPFWRYFTVISVSVYVYQLSSPYSINNGNLIDSVRRRCVVFPLLRSIPSCTTDMNLSSCILNRHKTRQSQIATIQESLPSHFVICRILWSWPWRHKLSPITLKTCSGYLGEYPCSLLTWIWKVSFLPILVLFQCYNCLCVCISVIKPIFDLQRKPNWKCPTSMCTCFLYWGVYPLALRTWIWEVAFWTVTKCDSHKLRQFRNPCRRILWFVAFCDHGRDGANWVQ